MEIPTDTNPFVVADAYRIGQTDGVKTGIAVGVVATILVKAALNNRKKNRELKWKFFTNKT